jgi:hypothetical protein
LILLSPLIDGKKPLQKIWRLLFAVGAVTAFSIYLPANLDIRAFIVTGVILALWKYFSSVVLSRPMLRVAGSVLLLSLFGALALWAPYSQRLTDAKTYNFNLNNNCPTIGAAWRFLEESLHDGARVACFGSARWLYYPAFGRRLRFVPYLLGYKPLHKDWRHGSFWNDRIENEKLAPLLVGRRRLKARSRALISMLTSAGVDYILMAKYNKNIWPPQRKMLAFSRQVQEVYNDGCSVIWRLRAL